MSHISEEKFMDAVATKLKEEYGEENVERQVYLDLTERYADFLVHDEMATYAIEVENDWEAALKGFGQAFLYAGHDSDFIPTLILPSGHVEHPEVDIMRRHIRVREIEVP